MAMMVQNLMEVLDSQASENPTLIFIMRKMYFDTFLRKTLSMMTSSKGFSEVRRRRRTHHQDLEVEVSDHLTVIHSFQVT